MLLCRLHPYRRRTFGLDTRTYTPCMPSTHRAPPCRLPPLQGRMSSQMSPELHVMSNFRRHRASGQVIARHPVGAGMPTSCCSYKPSPYVYLPILSPANSLRARADASATAIGSVHPNEGTSSLSKYCLTESIYAPSYVEYLGPPMFVSIDRRTQIIIILFFIGS